MKSRILALGCVAALALAAPAFGHHSFAMFDSDKTVELEGTVKEFQWTNPHSWLQVLVVDGAGQEIEWSLELGSPAQIARRGWRPRTVSPGDTVSVALNPLFNGEPIGSLVGIALPDGSHLGEEEFLN